MVAMLAASLFHDHNTNHAYYFRKLDSWSKNIAFSKDVA